MSAPARREAKHLFGGRAEVAGGRSWGPWVGAQPTNCARLLLLRILQSKTSTKAAMVVKGADGTDSAFERLRYLAEVPKFD